MKKKQKFYYFLFTLISIISLGIWSCGSQKIILTKPINGYVTFSAIEFAVNDDEEVSILLTYVCHKDSLATSNDIAERIKKDLSEIALNVGMDAPTTSISDSIGQTLILADNYSKVKDFFDNVTMRFQTISIDPKVRKQKVVLNAKFSQDTLKDIAEFNFSSFLFEPYALISFKSQTGNLSLKNNYNSSLLSLRTSTNNYLDFVILPQKNDYNEISSLVFEFNKAEHWYSFLQNLFSKNKNETTPEKIVQKTIEKPISGTNEGFNFDDIIEWIKSKLDWIAGTVIPILSFLGITILRRKNNKSENTQS